MRFLLSRSSFSLTSIKNMTHKERTIDNYRSNTLCEVIVSDIIKLSDTVKEYIFTVPNNNGGFKFKPGQWVDVHVPDDETIIGGYSITSSPNQFIQSGNFKLAIQYSTHPPTEWMHTKCQVGTKIRIRVGGDFVYDPTPSLLSDLFLVAGGIGINPIFSIMKHQKDLINQSKPSRTPNNILLYSTRNCNELIFKSDIDEVCLSHDGIFKSQYFSTRDTPTNEKINYFRMTESHILDSIKHLDPAHFQCYICGPPPLINFVTQTLTDNGINESAIHYEKWW